jgi:hypothetical protein
MLQSHRPFSGSTVAKASGRWHRRVASVLPAATKTPYPDTTREINTEAPTDVVYDAVIVGGRLRSDSNSSSSNRGQPVTIATTACSNLHTPQVLYDGGVILKLSAFRLRALASIVQGIVGRHPNTPCGQPVQVLLLGQRTEFYSLINLLISCCRWHGWSDCCCQAGGEGCQGGGAGEVPAAWWLSSTLQATGLHL